MAPQRVTAYMLREGLAELLWSRIKADDLPQVCTSLGMEVTEERDPFYSKRGYVRACLQKTSFAELVDRLGARGVAGDLKNLIFAADGPKPELVLEDALNNVIRITKNEEYCLVYDRPLANHGLTWRELVSWWAQREGHPSEQERDNALDLYQRLQRPMRRDGNGIELDVFATYAALYRKYGYDIPALLPQVYLHYDPYARGYLGPKEGPLARQRMDFVLLMSQRARVVIEIDGRHHYADTEGRADPGLYAAMVAEDRKLRLARYEVYRFGASELKCPGAAKVVDGFFRDLLALHGHTPQT